MKTLTSAATILFLLAPSIASAATYSVEATVEAPTEISISIGTRTAHEFTIENTGDLDDTYTVDVSSEMGWADTGGFPVNVSVAADASKTVSVDMLVPTSVSADSRGEITLTAVSINDHINSTDSAVLNIQLEGATPRPSIEGPSSGVTGELFTITLKGVDSASFIQNRGFDFHIDWDGNGNIDEVVTGRADGKSASHTYMYADTYKIIVKAVDRSHDVEAYLNYNVEITGDNLLDPENRRLPSHLTSDNPCGDITGLSLQFCLNEFRRDSSLREDIASRRDVRSARLMRGDVGRRAAVLRERATNRRSTISPFYIESRELHGVTDPRPAGERLNEVSNARTRTISEMANRRAALRGRTANLLRSQVNAGNRKTATSSPLCARRNGLRLIGCLLELGIEINRWTADEETLDIWENLREELGE